MWHFCRVMATKNIFMDDNMRTNRDIVVSTVLKKLEIIPWVSPRVL